MEVESTTRSAKERVAGFEDREGHRTPFASIFILPVKPGRQSASSKCMPRLPENTQGETERLPF